LHLPLPAFASWKLSFQKLTVVYKPEVRTSLGGGVSGRFLGPQLELEAAEGRRRGAAHLSDLYPGLIQDQSIKSSKKGTDKAGWRPMDVELRVTSYCNLVRSSVGLLRGMCACQFFIHVCVHSSANHEREDSACVYAGVCV
jgi:hypothetical protein